MLDALSSAGADVSRPMAMRCPFHADETPSAGVYQEDGVWKFKCHAASCGFQGDVFDVLARVSGRDVRDVVRDASLLGAGDKAAAPAEKHSRVWPTLDVFLQTLPNVEATYSYTDPDTRQPSMFVVRYVAAGRKHFAQAHPVDGGVVAKAPPKPWPIYNRTRLRGATDVVVCEGEKCVHALHSVGVIATTSPGGAGKAKHADWSPLAAKRVWLWPDNDPADPKTGERAGIRHMREVARILETIDPPPLIRWIDPDLLGLPDKGDAADLVAREGVSAEAAVRRIMAEASSLGASADVMAEVRDEIEGRRRAIELPWPETSRASMSLLPKALTLVCGQPGAAKSYWVMQVVSHLVETGEKVAILVLEEDRTYHLRRVVASRSRCPRFNDPAWVRENPDEAEAMVESCRGHIDALGRCVSDWKGEPPTLDDVAEWVDAQAVAGKRVIVVDPITAVGCMTTRSWEEERAFVMRAKAIAATHECSIVLVTHPKPGAKGRGDLIESMAGSQAYPRFASCILWLMHLPEGRTVVARKRTIGGPLDQAVEPDRLMVVVKARNGPGTGSRIAYRFGGNGLCFEELGVVVRTGDE